MFTYNAQTGVHTSELNDGQAHFGALRGQWSSNWQVYAADFTNAGLTDFFLYNAVSGQWYKALSTGTGDFTYFGGQWSAGWQVFVVDLNGLIDHHGDVFLSNPTTGEWYRAVQHGDRRRGL